MNSIPPTDHYWVMSDFLTLDCLYVDVDEVERLRKEVDSARTHPVQKGMHRLSKAGIGFLLVVAAGEEVYSLVE